MAVVSNTQFHKRLAEFLARFPGFEFRPTQYGFDLNRSHFFYRHTIEKPAGRGNRVWQWSSSQSLLKEFAGEYKRGFVLLEALMKPSHEHACFRVPANELCPLVKRRTFSVPADDGHPSDRPLVRLVKDNRFSDHALKKIFRELSA
jgi:hypothetical protein